MKNHTFHLWKIKELMKQHGFTQEDMAINLKISANQMRAKLNGKQNFWVHELITITDLFGEHPGSFFITNVALKSTTTETKTERRQ